MEANCKLWLKVAQPTSRLRYPAPQGCHKARLR